MAKVKRTAGRTRKQKLLNRKTTMWTFQKVKLGNCARNDGVIATMRKPTERKTIIIYRN